MDPKELLKAGRLSEARKQLTEEVKASPSDLGKRTLLFQVLSFCGEWRKAEIHLDAIVAQDSSKETGVQMYKNLIHAEKDRVEVLKLNRRPSFLPEMPSHVELYFSALKNVADGKIEEAEKLFDQIEAQHPRLSGTVDGKAFNGFKDTDTVLSLFLEAIVYERYVWIPFGSIRELSVSSPRTLSDLLWITARITTWEGLTLNCYLPVLYPDSFLHEDDRVKLGRITDWSPLGGSFSRAMGQHVFQIGEEEAPLLEIQEVSFRNDEKKD
jgi:type VI secretion system protein ImpE